MIRAAFYLLLALCLGGCPRAQQLSAESVEAAVQTNNAMAAALTAIQERARVQRKAAMVQAAKTVGSYAEGQQQLDAIERSYEPVFEVRPGPFPVV